MQAARGASLTPEEPAGPHPDATDATEPSIGDRAGAPPARRRALTLFVTIAATGWAIDLVTKSLAVAHLDPFRPVSVVGRLLTLQLTRNSGAAFSTGTSYTVVLSVVAIAAAVGVLWVSRRLASVGWGIALGFLLAGILGNLTDRIFRAPGPLRGHVVDFLALPHWPIFNVADMCINVAAVVIVVQALRGITLAGTRTTQRTSARR